MKITKATFKSFVNKNRDKLLIKVPSNFDDMVDCVMETGDKCFQPIKIDTRKDLEETHTLGILGLWMVGHGGDYFTAYNDGKYIGFEVYNCCGNQILVTNNSK